MGSKGSGGRLGHGGAQQDAQLKVLMYEERCQHACWQSMQKQVVLLE